MAGWLVHVLTVEKFSQVRGTGGRLPGKNLPRPAQCIYLSTGVYSVSLDSTFSRLILLQWEPYSYSQSWYAPLVWVKTMEVTSNDECAHVLIMPWWLMMNRLLWKLSKQKLMKLSITYLSSQKFWLTSWLLWDTVSNDSITGTQQPFLTDPWASNRS